MDRYIRLHNGIMRSTGKRAQVDAARYNKWIKENVKRHEYNEMLREIKETQGLDAAIKIIEERGGKEVK